MVQYIRSDLDFILAQIKIAEAHAAGQELTDLIPNPFLPYGLRTVDGRFNNLLPGQTHFGAANTTFPSLLPQNFGNGTDNPFIPGTQIKNYAQPGSLFDSQPRLISNLISDQTANNPAAVAASESGDVDALGNLYIPNVAPDEGLSAPFNSWMTLFGQFFDHGLDLVTKGGNGTVFVPLAPDDPLYSTEPDAFNFMLLNRATNIAVQAGEDNEFGTADDVHTHMNTTTSWVDQNQTYTSDASHQVFLREYVLNGAGDPVCNGRMLEGANGGLATWGEVKAQAASMLGIQLTDADVGNVPTLATDFYGKFIPGPNGYAQLVLSDGTFLEGDPTANGGLGIEIPANALRTGHAFLDDIAHSAAPGTFDDDGNPNTPGLPKTADLDGVIGDDGDPSTFDDELLDAHYITGDGRGNENIGLTTVHFIFHAEHNRLVEHTQSTILADAQALLDGGATQAQAVAFLNEWLLAPVTAVPAPEDFGDLVWNGERLFQAARFGNEMQYQHLVFEEFARKVQPMVNVFGSYDATIDPSIVAEFAHVVYRFGHSMLTESIDRYDAGFNADHIGLIEGFLNPVEFTQDGAVSQSDMAGAIIRGMTRQTGNAIDEFITEALRNNLLGLPLDLGTINLARGRETGVPTLNDARREFFTGTGDAQLKPYENWVDFASNVKNEMSVINFIASYGTHAALQASDVDTAAEKRAVAWALVFGGDAVINEGTDEERVFTADDTDRWNFLHGQEEYANEANGRTTTGVDNIDFWIGGLAEKTMPFGGMLGSTFNFVFENQMEALQDGDRFYYLGRTVGLNFLQQLENNSFAGIIMRHTDVTHLPGDVFSNPNYILEVNQSLQFNEGLGSADPTGTSIFNPLVIRNNPATQGPDTNYLKFTGGEHVVLGGTEEADILIAGIGDDTLWGDGGNDRLEGGAGNDIINGGDGDDILDSESGDDIMVTGAGVDRVEGMLGFDWATYKNESAGIEADLNVRAFALPPLPGSPNAFLDRFDLTEGLSGTAYSDILRGDDADALTMVGHELKNFDLISGLKDGLNPFFHENLLQFTGGNIILGGAGSDVIEGRGGNDIIDGDAWLNVRLSIRDAVDPELELFSANSMTEFQHLMFSGAINPGQIQIVREILMSPTEDFDTAVFSGMISEYSIEGGGVDEDGDGFITVSHNSVTLGLGQGADGVDKVRNIERLQFADAALVISGANEPPAGELTISDETPTEDQVLSVNALNVTDPDNIAPGNPTGAITGPISYFWQAETEPGSGVFADIEFELLGEIVKATGTTFKPGDDQVGLALRVRGVYQDANGVIEEVFSAQTDVVANINDAPVGTVLINDTTPAEDQVLTAVNAFTDADGLNGATFTYQWQEFVGGDWANIDGAVTENFAPDQAQVGNKIRVIVSYTDDGGANESVTSAETAPVTNTNDLPFGDLTIDDMTPTEGQALTATVEFVDQDGMTGATFLYQWQSFDGSDWVDIAGANASSFTPTQDEVNRELRVRVTYTDDLGTVESVTSLATIVTGDLVNGTVANELINGTAGQDILFGGAGTDTLNGGAENDTLFGGEGNDAVNGGSGDDTINFTMGEETDTVNGGDDFDTMNVTGRATSDTLRVLFDGSVLTRVSGGAVTNVEAFNVNLLGGSDTLSYDPTGLAVTTVGITVDLNAGTATGFDSIAGIENAQGGSGNDSFVGDANDNNFAGGLGTDTYSLAHTSAGAIILTNSASSAEAGLDALSSVENYIGSQGNDTITVNGANNLIDGQAGDDTIDAGGGADTVLGGAGNDTINYTTGNGADTIDGGADFDTLAVRGTGGSNTLGVVFNGTLLTSVAGGAVSNVEAITLDLLGGTDTLSYGVGAAAVTVDLSAGTASGFASIAGVENVTGGNGGDTITGRTGTNVLSGGGGADRFIAQAGDGNDTINGDGGIDTYDLSGTTAGATISNVSASSAQIGSDTLSSIENFIGSQGGDVISVNGGPNVIDGQGGADNINAGGGADTVTGGAGDDTINGGTGNDTLVFGAGFGNDTIIGFDALPGGGGQDIIRLDASLGITAGNFGTNVGISSANGGADTLITIGANTITLLGVASTDVTINDFTFGT